MSKKGHPKSRKSTARRTLLAAASIVSVAAGTSAWAGEIPPNAIHVTSEGVSIHDDALAAALISDKAETVRSLQARFPGLTPDQISTGPDNSVSLAVRREALVKGTVAHPDDNSGCSHTNSLCTNNGCTPHHLVAPNINHPPPIHHRLPKKPPHT